MMVSIHGVGGLGWVGGTWRGRWCSVRNDTWRGMERLGWVGGTWRGRGCYLRNGGEHLWVKMNGSVAGGMEVIALD